MQKAEELAATVKPDISTKEDAHRTAMGSLVAAAFAPKDAQPSASSTTTDKCSLRDIMDQETEVRVTLSCALIHSKPTANAASILITIMVMATARGL